MQIPVVRNFIENKTQDLVRSVQGDESSQSSEAQTATRRALLKFLENSGSKQDEIGAEFTVLSRETSSEREKPTPPNSQPTKPITPVVPLVPGPTPVRATTPGEPKGAGVPF